MDESHFELLRQVSRSFYLSLRLLDAPMRGVAALAYLLARSSDTVADHAHASVAQRSEWLAWFARRLAGDTDAPCGALAAPGPLQDPAEQALLGRVGELLGLVEELPAAEAALVREVMAVILSGQQLDLSRFGAATGDRPVVLGDAGALDDYTWRVAGCVGLFWTRLAVLKLPEPFVGEEPMPLIEQRAIDYGKGLQLVNILRDLPRDLAAGRCYLPVADPTDREALIAEARRQMRCAATLLDQGIAYGGAVRCWRLRVASLMPAMLGELTLRRLEHADWQALCAGIKVTRMEVYLTLLRCLLHGSRT